MSEPPIGARRSTHINPENSPLDPAATQKRAAAEAAEAAALRKAARDAAMQRAADREARQRARQVDPVTGAVPVAPAPTASPPRRKGLLYGVIGAVSVLLLAVVTVTVLIVSHLNAPANETTEGGDIGLDIMQQLNDQGPVTFLPDSPALTNGEGPCIALRVMSSVENAQMVESLAYAYNDQPRNVGGSCVEVITEKEKSGVAADFVADGFSQRKDNAKPAMWIPDSNIWADVARAGNPGNVRNAGTRIAYSDVVAAMPQSLADAIGWTETNPSWKDIFEASEDPQVWSNLGHPEWGSFKLGKTSPLVATSGNAALLTSFGAASGTVGDLSEAKLSDKKVRAIVREYELATSHYMSTPEHFLWHAREAEESGSSADFLSAVIVDEKSVWDYNRGISSRDGVTRIMGDPPEDPLVPIYPSDGYYTADNTAMTLSGSWVTDEQEAAAKDFLRFAQTIEGQAAIRDSGYRDLNRMLDEEVAQVGLLDAGAKNVLPLPRNRITTAIQSAFPDVRKRANVLFLLDVSGSMDEPISKNETRLTQAKKAIEEALEHFTPGDQVGLAAFAQSADGQFVPGTLTPVGDISTNRRDLLSALKNIASMGDTPLYEAVDRYAKEQAKTWSSDRINAIVVLSDGENDVNTETTEFPEMEKTLKALQDTTPVQVFTLAYGEDADPTMLQTIASMTGAHFYDASDPLKLKQVLGELVTSF